MPQVCVERDPVTGRFGFLLSELLDEVSAKRLFVTEAEEPRCVPFRTGTYESGECESLVPGDELLAIAPFSEDADGSVRDGEFVLQGGLEEAIERMRYIGASQRAILKVCVVHACKTCAERMSRSPSPKPSLFC